MKIKYKEYTLEPESTYYNLYKDVKKEIYTPIGEKGVKSQPTGKFHTVTENLGYGMSFERCVEIIIKDSLNSKKETLTLRGYIDKYKKLKTKILDETR